MDLVSGPPSVVGVVLWSSALDMGFWANRVKVTCTSPWQQCILCRLNTQSSTYYSSPYDVVDYLETKGNAWSPDFSSLWRRYICMVCVCVCFAMQIEYPKTPHEFFSMWSPCALVSSPLKCWQFLNLADSIFNECGLILFCYFFLLLEKSK